MVEEYWMSRATLWLWSDSLISLRALTCWAELSPCRMMGHKSDTSGKYLNHTWKILSQHLYNNHKGCIHLIASVDFCFSHKESFKSSCGYIWQDTSLVKTDSPLLCLCHDDLGENERASLTSSCEVRRWIFLTLQGAFKSISQKRRKL